MMSPLPALNIRPAMSPRLAAFWNRIHGMGMPSSSAKAMHWAATNELLVHTCSANDAAGFWL
jgi:hypothetical protein